MTRRERVSMMVRSRNGKTGVRVINSRPKKPRFYVTRRQVFLIIFMLFLFMGSSIGYVWSNFKSTRIGYDLSQLKRDEMKLREENQRLRLELAVLKSPERLEAEAIGRFGLRQPTPEQIIVLK
jgi:cell division protein FtsL